MGVTEDVLTLERGYLEELPGVGVDVVARNALKPRDEHVRAEAVDL